MGYKWFIIFLILIVGIYCTVAEYKKNNNIKRAILSIVGSISIGLLSSFIYDAISPSFFYSATYTSSIPITSHDYDESNGVESDVTVETESIEDASSSINGNGPSYADITGKTTISGSMTYKEQEDKYQFTTSISGTYCFDTDLSSGGKVYVRIRGENGKSIDYGKNGLTTELEAGKTYVLCVAYYDGPCDYTIHIGKPNAMTDITGKNSISGSITYKNQEDKYRFTTSTGGTYRFDTDLSSGGKVKVKIKGENGNSIDYSTNGLTTELEAGKTYILCVVYYNGPCDYTIDIGKPNAMIDITGKSSISGSITYKDQENKYQFTTSSSGTYYFDTDLSSGGKVYVRIRGENGNSIDYGANRLTTELEAGKTYILCVDYYNGPCDYEVSIRNS